MLKSLSAADKGVRAATYRLRLSAQRLPPLAQWIPVAAAGTYFLVLASQVGRLLDSHYHWRPDFIWAPLLARDLAAYGHGGLINVGDTPHYSTIWFLMLTERLPFSGQIWEFGPFFITLAGLALMAWAARKVAGAWAGFMTLAIGIAAGTEVFSTTLTEGMRSHTWFAAGATSALLVYLATRPDGAKPGLFVGAGVLAGIFGGVTLASDPLFAVCGLAPLIGATTLGWLRFRTDRTRDLALVAWASAVLAIGLAVVIESRMHAAGYRKTLLPSYNFVTLDEFVGAAKGLVLDTLTVTNGNFFGQPVGLRSLAALGMAVLTVGALCVPVVLLAPRLRGVGTETDQKEPWVLYLLFWALAQLATAAAYLLSPIPTAFGQSLTTRYVVPIFYGIAATVPVWASESNLKKTVAAGGTVMLCVLSLLGLRTHLAEQPLPIQPQASEIAAFLGEQGLDRGYASYRIAHPLTYHADMRRRIYPVYNCRHPSPDVCPFYVNTRSSWYRPVAGKRTFLIADPPDYLSIPSPPPEIFGEPSLVRKFGGFSVLVYDYDIASRFVKPPASSG